MWGYCICSIFESLLVSFSGFKQAIVVSGICTNYYSILKTVCANSYNHVAKLDYIELLSSKQISSWKELDVKIVALVHLDQKGIEEYQDWME